MNIFKIKSTWSNAEMAVLKLCVASAYVVIGATFHDFFQKYLIVCGVIFVISTLWILKIWRKKEKF